MNPSSERITASQAFPVSTTFFLGMRACRRLRSTLAGVFFLLLLGVMNAPSQTPPSVTFAGVQTTVPATGLSFPYGVAVDGAGDLFIADSGNLRIVEIPANCDSAACQITVASGQELPDDVIVDGAGDLYVLNDTSAGNVIEIPAGCTSSSCQITIASGLDYPQSAAVDLSGNVFIAVNGNNRVLEVPAGCSSAVCQITVGSGFNGPTGVALDGTGDLFIVDQGNSRVVEVPAGCTSATCQLTLATGLDTPTGLAVDGAGDLFVTLVFGSAAVEIPAGCASSSCQIPLGSGLHFPQNLTVDQSGDVFIADSYNNRVLEVELRSVNFGAVSVGSESPLTLSFSIASNVILGATPSVVTQGAAGLDFESSGTPTCTAAQTAGSTCTVTVQFAPLAPGSRKGAVQLLDSSGNLQATVFLRGTGSAPELAFAPGIQTTAAGGVTYPFAVAVDAAGDLFAGYSSSQVAKVPAGCTSASCFIPLGNGIVGPQSVAVDGAGNVFIADLFNTQVVEIPASCVPTNSCQNTVVSGLQTPVGVAVDGQGDLFIADTENSEILEVPPGCTSSPCRTALMSDNINPWGVTLDNAGDLLFSEIRPNQVVESPRVGAGFGSPVTIATGLGSPGGVAVDGAGDIFIADGESTSVLEVPADGSAQTELGTGLNTPSGLAVDGAGDVFIADHGGQSLVELERSQASPLNFGTVLVGSSSAAQTVTIQNVGNQPLTFTNFKIDQNFQLDSSTTSCSTSSSLAPGAICSIGVICSPTTLSSGLSGNLSLFDNTLNQPQGKQAVSLSCASSLAEQTITFALPASVQALTSLALTGTASSGLPVAYTSNTPTVCSVSGSTAQFVSSGTCTIAASQAGNSNYNPATPVTASTTVTPAPQTITFTLPASTQALTSLALTGTASSGLPVAYTSSTPTVCSASGSTAQFLTSGTCTISASQAGNSVYGAATPVPASTKVTAASQTITFSPLSSPALQGSKVTLTATSTSGLAVTFTSLTPAVCSVSGSSATLLNAGTCTTQASQPGNASYAPATPVSQSVSVTAAFTITPTPKVETIRRGNIAAFILELQAASGFSGKVTLSCSGSPSGSYCVDFPMTVSFQKGVALAVSGIYFPPTTPPGTYMMTITGTSGSISNTTTTEFIVNQ